MSKDDDKKKKQTIHNHGKVEKQVNVAGDATINNGRKTGLWELLGTAAVAVVSAAAAHEQGREREREVQRSYRDGLAARTRAATWEDDGEELSADDHLRVQDEDDAYADEDSEEYDDDSGYDDDDSGYDDDEEW